MSDDGSSDAVSRVRRAKARRAREANDRWLDGGAVAAGVVAVLGPQIVPALAIAVGLPRTVVTAVVAVTALAVPLGGFVAGWLGGPGGRPGARHGGTAVALSAFGGGLAALVVGGLDATARLTPPNVAVALPLTVIVATAVGAAAGYLGGSRRPGD